MLEKGGQKGSPVRPRATWEDLLPVLQCPLGLETGKWQLGTVQFSLGASGTCVVGLQDWTAVGWVPWAVKSQCGEEMWCSPGLGAVREVC